MSHQATHYNVCFEHCVNGTNWFLTSWVHLFVVLPYSSLSISGNSIMELPLGQVLRWLQLGLLFNLILVTFMLDNGLEYKQSQLNTCTSFCAIIILIELLHLFVSLAYCQEFCGLGLVGTIVQTMTFQHFQMNHIDLGQFKVKPLFPLSSFFDSLIWIVMFATDFKSML